MARVACSSGPTSLKRSELDAFHLSALQPKNTHKQQLYYLKPIPLGTVVQRFTNFQVVLSSNPLLVDNCYAGTYPPKPDTSPPPFLPACLPSFLPSDTKKPPGVSPDPDLSIIRIDSSG